MWISAESVIRRIETLGLLLSSSERPFFNWLNHRYSVNLVLYCEEIMNPPEWVFNRTFSSKTTRIISCVIQILLNRIFHCTWDTPSHRFGRDLWKKNKLIYSTIENLTVPTVTLSTPTSLIHYVNVALQLKSTDFVFKLTESVTGLLKTSGLFSSSKRFWLTKTIETWRTWYTKKFSSILTMASISGVPLYAVVYVKKNNKPSTYIILFNRVLS